MLMPSFTITTLRGIVLGSAMALLTACGGSEDTQPPQDKSPDSFAFAPVINVAPGTEVMSNEIVVSGINAPTTISVSGGSYAIAGSSYTSAAGTVVSGQIVQVKISAPSTPSAAAEAILTIGDASGKFSVMTATDLSTSPVPSSSSRAASSVAMSATSSTSYSRNASNSSTASSVVIVVPGSSIAASSNAMSSIARSSDRSSAALSSASSAQSSSSSVRSSSLSSSSVASSRAAASTRWMLERTASYLSFVSAKNTHSLEVNHFTEISGDISSGIATLVINLDSVNSGIALRDQRLRDLLFETMTFPAATVTVNLPAGLPNGMEVGVQIEQDVTAELDLHGVKKTLTTRLAVQKLSSSRVVVQTIAPVLLKTSDYALSNGIEALRGAVGIASISAAVPVDFTLVFDAR